MDSQRGQIILLLKVATFFVFTGRSYQFLFFDAPLRVILWDQGTMEGLIRMLLGIDWDTYATSPEVDRIINILQLIAGGILGLAALSVFLIQSQYNKIRWIIILGLFILLILNALQFKDRFYQIPVFLEHLTQVITPLLLLFYVSRKKVEWIVWLGKIAIALTFFSHGLYAIGFYPTPGKFIDLVIGTFHWSEEFSTSFVFIAGWIDIIVAVALFFRPFTKQALLYMTFWGLATALSRVTSGVYEEFFWQSLHQNLHLTLYRLCHGLIPLTIYFLQINYLKQSGSQYIYHSTD